VMELQRTQGAKVKLTLEIEAEAAAGFAEGEVSVVRDNARQLKFKAESTGFAWDRMERTEIRDISPPIVVTTPTKAPMLAPVDPATLPDGAWVRPSDGADATLAQLAALIKALPGPTPIARIRLAALYALEPRYLTRRLSGADRTTWLRLSGAAAKPLAAANVAAFAPKIDAGWRDAVTQLRGMGAIIEDSAAQTWAGGPKLDDFEIDPTPWPHGRATFVLKALEAMTLDDATAQLPAEDQAWVKAYAA
jgi:hypothetical protein